MQLIDFSMNDPAMDVALDEVLLSSVDRGERPDLLRFWSVNKSALILGRGQDAKKNANIDVCESENVNIIRRFSGGGAVLLGAGVLCYTYVLKYENHPATHDLRGSYAYVSEYVLAGLSRLGVEASLEPVSDIAVNGRKICGNAQARRRNCFLQHGTLLVLPLVKMIDRYLPHPDSEPEYRGGRTHADFVSSLRKLGCLASESDVKRALISVIGEVEPSDLSSKEMMQAKELAVAKYHSKEWNMHGKMPRG